MFLTPLTAEGPWDSRFTPPLPCGHQRRPAGFRPTGSDGSPRTRQAPPAGLAGCSTPACTGVLEHGERLLGALHVEQMRVDLRIHVADEESREHVTVLHHPAAAAVDPLAERLLGDRPTEPARGEPGGPDVDQRHLTAGACSLAGEGGDEHARRPAAHAAPEGTLECSV